MNGVIRAAVVAVLVSCLAGPASAQSKLPADAPKLDFKKEAEVQALLGPPDAKIVEPDRVIWLYNRKVKNVFGEMAYPELRFVKGEVRSIQWLNESRMAERLRDAKR